MMNRLRLLAPLAARGLAAVTLPALLALHVLGSHGVRIGPWLLPPLAATWVVGAALLVALALPARGENHRYKSFVEPVLWVFLATQAHALVSALRPTGAPSATARRG